MAVRLVRVLLEIFHVFVGLIAAAAIGGLAAWAYPIGRDNIWLVTWVAMAAVVVMGIKPIGRAARGLPRDD